MQSKLIISPEFVAAWRRCCRLRAADADSDEARDAEQALDRLIACALGRFHAADGPCPWPPGSAGACSWPLAQALRRRLEPIQEVIESGESVVILYRALDSRGGAPDVEAGTPPCCRPQRSSLPE
jgi:hypothetical protein